MHRRVDKLLLIQFLHFRMLGDFTAMFAVFVQGQFIRSIKLIFFRDVILCFTHTAF